VNSASAALFLLAAAIPLTPRTTTARLNALHGRRTLWSPNPTRTRAALAVALGLLAAVITGLPAGPPAGAAVTAAAWWFLRRQARARTRGSDPLALAAAWDLLTACLRSGLPVPTAITAVVDGLPPPEAQALRSTADLLAMGADPAAAWLPALRCPSTAALARAARHTARSGTALADATATLAAKVRADAEDAAEAMAQRAGVLVAAPLGLCFLPAFICLGIAPAVTGLATHLTP